jgi:hypothetical protein
LRRTEAAGRARSGDAELAQGRHQERPGVDGHRQRCGEQQDKAAAEGRTGNVDGRTGQHQGAVGRQQLLAGHEHRCERLAGDGVEQGAHAGQHHHGVQLRQGERAEHRGQRDRADQQQLTEVGEHEDSLVRQAIHPHAGRQPEREMRQEAGRAEEAHLDRRGVQGDHRGQRQRHRRHAGSQQGHRVPDEQPAEVLVAHEQGHPGDATGRPALAAAPLLSADGVV